MRFKSDNKQMEVDLRDIQWQFLREDEGMVISDEAENAEGAEEAAKKVDLPPAKKNACKPKRNKRKMPKSVPAEVRLKFEQSFACMLLHYFPCVLFRAWLSGPSPRTANSLLTLF